ncbi:hypothetical protein TrST_g1478 [Triparma strigata]|uniref:Uncharacterized protein n=1 Tax=Triparma strigata TaxID=1606541 RepID=A0A9W7AGK0_9STRA|nr:hypothetical protein TrST_g1478 [Triparma strigata]
MVEAKLFAGLLSTPLLLLLFLSPSDYRLIPALGPADAEVHPSNFSTFPPPVSSCLVRGGAFKGFYFSLGYLRGVERKMGVDSGSEVDDFPFFSNASSVHHASNTTTDQIYPIPAPRNSYHCYSGGCFAVVAHLMDISLDDILAIGLDLQQKWMKGEISRFDIVSKFIDEVLPTNPNTPLRESLKNQLNIITSTTALQPNIQKPTNFSSIKKLLVQTSWIPGVTGNSLFVDGAVDGFLSSYKHPVFKEELAEQPWDLSGFKISMSKEDAEDAYRFGYEIAKNNSHAIC